jgi:hypothetical protein
MIHALAVFSFVDFLILEFGQKELHFVVMMEEVE